MFDFQSPLALPLGSYRYRYRRGMMAASLGPSCSPASRAMDANLANKGRATGSVSSCGLGKVLTAGQSRNGRKSSGAGWMSKRRQRLSGTQLLLTACWLPAGRQYARTTPHTCTPTLRQSSPKGRATAAAHCMLVASRTAPCPPAHPLPPSRNPTYPNAAPRLLFTACWWLASSMNRYTSSGWLSSVAREHSSCDGMVQRTRLTECGQTHEATHEFGLVELNCK